jgi:hypothetical protein
MNAMRLKKHTAISVLALSAVWLIFSLSKGRLDLVPLAYGGFAIPLLLNERENSRGVVCGLNLFAGAGACLFLTVFAAFGVTLDGPITSAFERGLVVLMCLWGFVNIAALICSGQMDGSWSQLLKRAATAGPATQEHDRRKPSLGLSLLALAQFVFSGAVFAWLGLLLVTWWFVVGFSPNSRDLGLKTSQPYVVTALIVQPVIVGIFALVSGLGYLVRSRAYGYYLGHVFAVTMFLCLFAITRGWEFHHLLLVISIFPVLVLLLLNLHYRKFFSAGVRAGERRLPVWIRGAGLVCMYMLAGFCFMVFARSLSAPTMIEVRREANELHECIANMEKIDEAKLAANADGHYRAGEIIPDALVIEKLPGGLNGLKCPKGGHYTINPALREPECSVHGKESEVRRRMDNL